ADALLPFQTQVKIHGLERELDSLIAQLYVGKITFGAFNVGMDRIQVETQNLLYGDVRPASSTIATRKASQEMQGVAARRHYAKLYARPGAMHAGFAQFAAFDQDAVDNRAFVAAGKLDVPVLALGGEKSFGTTMAAVMRFAASDVEEGVVPDSGHWIMEENPKATIALVRAFLAKNQ